MAQNVFRIFIENSPAQGDRNKKNPDVNWLRIWTWRYVLLSLEPRRFVNVFISDYNRTLCALQKYFSYHVLVQD